jgi:hypothetical protein
MTSIGTRKPNPIGPEMGGLPMMAGSGTAGTVTNSPGVPGGATAGATWSKSAVLIVGRESTVFAHCAGIAIKAETTKEREHFAEQ